MYRICAYLLFLALVPGMPSLHASGFQDEKEVSIGLLLADRSDTSVVRAAEMAIEKANREGGYRGVEFSIYVRTAEGFWGAGSKESVSLVYEDRVRAIIGSLDGRNGHLAEQVATKSHLAYVECLATEPTLSQAFVPWFTRLVPNDNQQARLLVEEIVRGGGGKTAVLTSKGYDSRYAVKSLVRELASAEITPFIQTLEPEQPPPLSLPERLEEAKIRHLILPFGSPAVDRLVEELKTRLPGIRIYGTLHFHMDLEERSVPLESYEGAWMIGSPHPWNREGQQLMTRWYERFGELPRLRQVYVYDAVNRLVTAIRETGLKREEISRWLLEEVTEGAVTGPVAYDELGNRLNAAHLVRVEKGRLIMESSHPL